jgi:hypothetical protein
MGSMTRGISSAKLYCLPIAFENSFDISNTVGRIAYPVGYCYV